MRGGGLPKFLVTFHISAFLVNNRSLFPPKFQLFELKTVFLGCIYIYTVYHNVDIIFLGLNFQILNFEF